MNVTIGPEAARAIADHEAELMHATQQRHGGGVEVIGPAVLLPDDEHYGLGAFQVWFPVECRVAGVNGKGEPVAAGHAQWAHVTPDGVVLFRDTIDLDDFSDV